MTLRQALKLVNREKVYKLIYQKDNHNEPGCGHTLEQIRVSYTHVIKELLSKPKSRRPYKYPWHLQNRKDSFDNTMYVDVSFLNPNYEAPPKGLKPWGNMMAGCRNTCLNYDAPPKGHYNCNASKYSKFFAAGLTPWKKIVDAEIVFKGTFSLEKIVAEILWEITFYGWTETQVENRVAYIKGSIGEAVKKIKAGKYIEIPPDEKGGYKIIVPDIVTKQLKEMTDRLPLKTPAKIKKCHTCWGNGSN